MRDVLLPIIKKGEEFGSQDELDEYLKDHPGADKSLHSVSESAQKGKGKDEGKGKGKGKVHPARPGGISRLKSPNSEDFQDETPPTRKDYKNFAKHPAIAALKANYQMDIVAGEDEEMTRGDLARAIHIAETLQSGITDASDICKIKPPICSQNKGIDRSSMPQLMDEPIKKMLRSDDPKDVRKAKAAIAAGADPESDKSPMDLFIDRLAKDGHVDTSEAGITQMAVGRLKATQANIKAKKTYSMAQGYLEGDNNPRGEWDPGDSPILVSSDGYILDGHHRWSAALTADPEKEMNVRVIDMPMDKLLEESFKEPGVFRADINDNIQSEDSPLDLAHPDGHVWQQRNGKWYGKKGDKAGGPYDTEDAAKNYAQGKKKNKKDEKGGGGKGSGASSTKPKGDAPKGGGGAAAKKETKKELKKASDFRAQTIRLAYENPELREHLLPLLKEGKAFSSQGQLDEYMKDHPNADPKNHKVEEGEGGGSAEFEGEGGFFANIAKLLKDIGKALFGAEEKKEKATIKSNAAKKKLMEKAGWGDMDPNDVEFVWHDDEFGAELPKGWKHIELSKEEADEILALQEAEAKAETEVKKYRKKKKETEKEKAEAEKKQKDGPKKDKEEGKDKPKDKKKDKPERKKSKAELVKDYQEAIRKSKMSPEDKKKAIEQSKKPNFDPEAALGAMGDDDEEDGGNVIQGPWASLLPQTIRLAYAHPELRPHLLPIIKKAGYTHYWEQSRDFLPEEWSTIVAAAKKIIRAAKGKGITIVDGSGKAGSRPVLNSKEIWLNGEGEEGHETFHLTQKKGEWDFCKTARKPYDAVVVSILAIAKKVGRDAIDVSSDGGASAIRKILARDK